MPGSTAVVGFFEIDRPAADCGMKISGTAAIWKDLLAQSLFRCRTVVA